MPKQQKIRVEVVGASPFPQIKKCPIEGNKVVLQKAREGRGGAAITADFDKSCLIPYYAGAPPFRKLKYKVVLKEGATHCVSFKDPENYVAPTLTILDVFTYFKASVHRAAAHFKPESKSITYVLLGVLIIIGILNVLVASGRIRL